jgi:cytochrome c553
MKLTYLKPRTVVYTLAALASSFAVSQSALAADVVGNAKAGQSKNALCIGCHGIEGYRASFPAVYSVPMIAGQNAKYLENALKAYKTGERKHPTMRSIAVSLSEQDMADLAAYYSNVKK